MTKLHLKLEYTYEIEVSSKKHPVLFRLSTILTFFVLALIIALSGSMFLKEAYQSSRETAFKELKTIGDSKAEQIIEWYSNQITQSDEIRQNSIIQEIAESVITYQASELERGKFLQWMQARQHNYRYSCFVLFNRKGKAILASPEAFGISEASVDKSYLESIRQNRIIVTDLRRNNLQKSPQKAGIHMNIWIPVSNENGVNGVWLVQLDPETYLYPLIMNWPTYSISGETLLVRREGDDVVYLNELRHLRNTAVNLRYNIEEHPFLPGVLAVKGKAGVIEGVDYRGIKVLAAIRAVEGTPWYIVSKIDRSEIYEPMRVRIWTIWSFILILIALVALGVGYREKNRDQRWMERHFIIDKERQQYAERIANLTRYANDIILLMDKNWHIIDANLKAQKLYGYSESELKQLKLTDLHTASEQRLLKNLDWHIMAEEGILIETSHITKDGKFIEVESSIRSLEIDGELYLQAIIRDISERKSQEKEIREMTSRLQEVINKAPFGAHSYIVDENNDLIFVSYNDSANVILGFDHLPLIGKKIEEIFPSHTTSGIPEIYRKVALHGEIYENVDYTYADKHLTGAFDVRAIQTGPRRVTSFFIDVTERKKAEQIIITNQERLKMSQGIGHVGSWEYNPQTGLIWGSEEAFRMYGLSTQAGEVPIEEVEACCIDRDFQHQVFADFVEHDKPYDLEIRIQPADGTPPRTVSSKAVKVYDPEGRLLKVVGVVQDITERKQSEIEKQKITQRLQTIIDQAPFGAYTYTLTDTNELIFSGYNLSADRIKSFDHSAYLGKTIEEAFPTLANSDIPDINRNVIRTGDVFERIEYAYQDAQIIEAYDVKTIKTGERQVTAFFVDVTERKRVEKVIADNQDRLNMSQAIGHVASWELDIQTGIVWSSNEGFKIFGLPQTETGTLPIQTVEAIIQDRKRVIQAMSDLIHHDTHYNLEYTINPADGRKPRIITSQAILVKDIDGKPHKVVGVIQDVTERRMADEQVQVANQRLKLATDAAKIGIWDLDLMTNELVWDDAMYELYGVDKELFPGAYDAWLACIDPRDREESDRISKLAVAGEIDYNTEFRIRWKDGITHYIKADGIVFRNEYGRAIRMLGTNWDITKIKAAEEKLRDNQDRLNMSQTIGHVGSWEYIIQTNIIWGSEETFSILGLPPQTTVIPAEEMEDLCMPDKVRVRKAMFDLIENGVPYDLEFEICPADGSSPRTVNSKAILVRDKDNSPLKVVGVMQDVTERRRYEETILHQNKLLQDLHDVGLTLNSSLTLPDIFRTLNTFISLHLPYEVFIVNRLNRDDDTIQYISYWMNNIQVDVSAMPRIPLRKDGTGLQSRVLITGESMHINTKEEYERLTKSNHHLSNNGKYLQDEERENDARKVESIILVPLIISGQVIGLLQVMSLKPYAYTVENLRLVESIAVHLASAMQNEELFTALEQSKDELEHRVIERTAQLSSANKELEAFSYSVSHDLRTPLRGIDGWSAVLLEDYSDKLDNQGKKGLETIREEAQHMGKLIDALLDLSKMSRSEVVLQETDLSLMAHSVINRLISSEPIRQIDLSIQPDMMDNCDPRLIEIALTNLFNNALKFSQNRKVSKIEFTSSVIDSKTVYCVKDNGVGFNMDHIGKLFGTFQRLHKAADFAGTGIGLATVKRIINRHGGEIWANSEVDKFAAFFFTLGEA